MIFHRFYKSVELFLGVIILFHSNFILDCFLDSFLYSSTFNIPRYYSAIGRSSIYCNYRCLNFNFFTNRYLALNTISNDKLDTNNDNSDEYQNTSGYYEIGKGNRNKQKNEIDNPSISKFTRSQHSAFSFSSSLNIVKYGNYSNPKFNMRYKHNSKREKSKNLTDSNIYDDDNGRSLSFQPPSFFRVVGYDYLSTNRLNCIEALPNLKYRKGAVYLIKWWNSIKKWGIFDDELEALDELVNNKSLIQNNNSRRNEHALDVLSTVSFDEDRVLYDDEVSVDDTIEDEDQEDATDKIGFDQEVKSATVTKDILKESIDSDSSMISSYSQANAEITQEELDFADQDVSNDISNDIMNEINLVETDDEFDTSEENEISSKEDLDSDLVVTNINTTAEVNIKDSYQRILDPNDIVPIQQLSHMSLNHHGRVICISDVHGCIDELRDLLRKVKYRPGDLVLFLGDLVAKGPCSVEVVKLAMDIGALCVRGNHEQEVIQQGILFRKKIGKYKNPDVRQSSLHYNEHLKIAMKLNYRQFKWLCSLPYYIKSPDLGSLFVHAGFQNSININEQPIWSLLTMRSLLPDGKASQKCIYKYPWADKWKGPLTVYFGHDAARGLQVYDHAIGLDTGMF